jgi:hypothetical protein
MRSFSRNCFVPRKGLCLLLLIWTLVVCSNGQSKAGSLLSTGGQQEMRSSANMNESVGKINVKAISVTQIQNFKGEAIRAHFDPNFVVALLLEKSEQDYSIPGTDITLLSNRVVFFAIHSVAQTFRGSDVLGKNYRMKVTMETTAGVRHYHLERM